MTKKQNRQKIIKTLVDSKKEYNALKPKASYIDISFIMIDDDGNILNANHIICKSRYFNRLYDNFIKIFNY